MKIKEFERVVRETAKRIPAEKLVVFQKKIVFEALAGFVKTTPVDTGRARGGWQVEIDQPGRADKKIRPAGQVMSEETAKLGKLPPFRVVFISNNVAYIEALENGHSKRSPNGMVAVTLARLRKMFP